MKVQRLRPAMSAKQLSTVYAVPHDHTHFDDHLLRVKATKEVGRKLRIPKHAAVADLSCGNGDIAQSFNVDTLYLGDLAPGYFHTGPIEETIEQIPKVDLFIFCETMEHVDDPLSVLLKIRRKTESLLLSTPVDAWDEKNPEHYWAWDRSYVERLLWQADFNPEDGEYVELDSRPFRSDFIYKWGIWGVR